MMKPRVARERLWGEQPDSGAGNPAFAGCEIDFSDVPVVGKKREAGFTLLELVVVVSLVAILAVVAIDRLLYVQEQAEKTVMEQTAGILKSALRLQVADLIARQETEKIAALAGQNPMNWLAERPAGYLGEFDSTDAPKGPRGSWYFDRTERALVYLVDRGAYFVPDALGRKQVRWRVVTVAARTQERPETADKSAIEGVTLAVIEAYKWF